MKFVFPPKIQNSTVWWVVSTGTDVHLIHARVNFSNLFEKKKLQRRELKVEYFNPK
jgi:hypothetical protein